MCTCLFSHFFTAPYPKYRLHSVQLAPNLGVRATPHVNSVAWSSNMTSSQLRPRTWPLLWQFHCDCFILTPHWWHHSSGVLPVSSLSPQLSSQNQNAISPKTHRLCFDVSLNMDVCHYVIGPQYETKHWWSPWWCVKLFWWITRVPTSW